jgi:hypothetical protein
MLYHRFYGLEPAGHWAAFDDAPKDRRAAVSDAKTLRERAAHCRWLAGTFYDQSIVTELETFARELEVEAATLDGLPSSGRSRAWSRREAKA